MLENNVFVVYCERIPRRQWYYLKFNYNDDLIKRIKELPEDTRKWSAMNIAWEVSTLSLYSLIKKYKGSNKIHFHFGTDESRKIFINEIKKLELAEDEKRRFIADLNVKKENWVKYKKELEETHEQYVEQVHKYLKPTVKLYPHQVVSTMFLNVIRSGLLALDMGTGKAQPLDSKILTPNGWVRMGDLNIGDEVIGSDGNVKKVLGVFPQGIKHVYEVGFNDGSVVKCTNEHLWSVKTPLSIGGNIDGNDNQFYLKTTEDLLNDGLFDNAGNRKYCIPIVKPIEFGKKELYIDPYVLGCALGNGEININNQKDVNDLIGCEFIPDQYKYSSIEDRINLLSGIFDTNGHPSTYGGVEVLLKSNKLVDDVIFIVQSLGGVAKFNNSCGKLIVKLPPNIIPFKLKENINTYLASTKYLPDRIIDSVRYIGDEMAQCILIDSDDHLYCTDNCVLTHNTIISIAFVEMNDFKKVLVITPNALKYNYSQEVAKFTGSNAFIVGSKNTCRIEDAKYVIVNYDYFNPSSYEKFKEKFNKLNIGKIDCLICDESHRISSAKSNTYKNFKKTFKDTIFRDSKASKIFMSGTPCPSKANQLYTVLHEISPLEFPNKNHFYSYYCGMSYDYTSGWGYNVNEMNTKFDELFHKIEPFVYRKKKSEVLKDLPEMIYQKIYLEMTPKEYEIYYDLEEGVANEFLNKEVKNPLAIMGKLREYTSHLKVNSIKELIDSLLESNEKFVAIDFFKKSLTELHEAYPDISVLHTGDVDDENRNKAVKEFQDVNSNVRIFLGSEATTKEGLTLTAASNVGMLTIPWTPGAMDQCCSRLQRIGQKYTVNAYIFVYKDSIDEYVFDLIESKKAEISQVIDGQKYESNIDQSIIKELIDRIKEKHKK